MIANTTKSLGCGYCRNIPGKNWRSHQIKDTNGNLLCRLLINKDRCYYCGERGHQKLNCELRIYREESDSKPSLKNPSDASCEHSMLVPSVQSGPSWAEKAAKNIPEEIKRVIDEETRRAAEKKSQEAQAKRELWAKRKVEREERMKKQAEAREQEHVANMQKKYGKFWYNAVVGGPEDCETAQELCRKEEMEYERDIRIQYMRDLEVKAEKNKNRQTWTYSEYMDIKWPDADFLPENHPIRQNFAIYGSWAAHAYYYQYGKMRPDNHFMGYAYGAELNPEVVERERIAEEKKFRELEKPVPTGRYGKIIGFNIIECNR